ncbi:hypothetical protein I352_04549 [Cryptococcus deuterogattii MMRL2647]|nr:hypothetical protein I352_04549 [Cryptococcus deuterogattii MMRL2647]
MTDLSKTLSGLAVENSVTESTKAWIRDLSELYEDAERLYPDIRWRAQNEQFTVWGHKAIVYARASKAFRDAFLPLRSFSSTAGDRSPLCPRIRDPAFSVHKPLQLLPETSENSINLALCNNDFVSEIIIHGSAQLLRTHLNCARYLQLGELVIEIESRIIHDLCHGLDWDHCHCKICFNRAVKLWCSLATEQNRPHALWSLATTFIERGWADCCGRDTATNNTNNAEQVEKLTHNVIEGIEASNVIYTFYSLHRMRMKLEYEKQTTPEKVVSSGWLNRLQQMIDAVQAQACEIIASSIDDVAASGDMRTLMQDQDPASLEILRIVLYTAAGRTSSQKRYMETNRGLSLLSSYPSEIDPSMRGHSSTSYKQSATAEILKGITVQGVNNGVKSPDGSLLEDKSSTTSLSRESFLHNLCPALKTDNHQEGTSNKIQLCNSGTSAYASIPFDAGKEVKEIHYKLPSYESVVSAQLDFARHRKAHARSLRPSRPSWRALLGHQPLLQKATIQSHSSLNTKENQTNKHRQASNMTETLSSKHGFELFVGVPCVIFSHAKRVRFRALVRYIGYIQGLHGTWIGVEVDNLDCFGIDTLPSAVANGAPVIDSGASRKVSPGSMLYGVVQSTR